MTYEQAIKGAKQLNTMRLINGQRHLCEEYLAKLNDGANNYRDKDRAPDVKLTAGDWMLSDISIPNDIVVDIISRIQERYMEMYREAERELENL